MTSQSTLIGFEEVLTMSPLQYFLSDLLGNHSGGIQLVVDNARLTRTPILPIRPVSTLSSSNHSCTRWETDEPSPVHTTAKTVTRTAPSTSLQRRSPVVVFNKSSPSCPIRKLSPMVTPKAEKLHIPKSVPSAANIKSPPMMLEELFDSPPGHTVARNDFEKRQELPTSTGIPRGASSSRQLLPPVQIRSLPQPSGPCPCTPTLNRPVSPVPTQAQPATMSVASAVNTHNRWPSKLLTRGLSQTLLGIDTMEEAAPICPTRRPSKQPVYTTNYVSTGEKASSIEHIMASWPPTHKLPPSAQSLDSSTQATECSSTSSARKNVCSDIVLTPIATDSSIFRPALSNHRTPASGNRESISSLDEAPPGTSSQVTASLGVGRPVFYQRLTKRREC